MAMDQKKVDRIIKKIFKQDSSAEKELFEYFKNEVGFLVKIKIGKNNPDWEDLRQDIFIAFFQRIRDNHYDSSKGTIGAFLQSTINFKIKDYQKSPAYKRRYDYDDITEMNLKAKNGNPEDKFADEQERIMLKKAISELEEPYKEVLFLSIYQQFKVKEISKKLGISEQRVSNLKSYALTLLKKKLDK